MQKSKVEAAGRSGVMREARWVGIRFVAGALLVAATVARADVPARTFASGQAVTRYLEQVAKEIAAMRSPKTRAARFNALVQEMKASETALGPARTKEENYTSLDVAYASGALDLIPKPPLTQKACRDTKSRIIFEFDPKAAARDDDPDTAPMLPGPVEAVLDVLKALCKR
jgi:hypothetical protein